MSVPAPTLVAASTGPGRRFHAERTVRLGDVLPSGRVRLDAVARYLQDVASDDGADAGIDRHLAWVVRRSVLRLDHRPAYGQRLGLVTWASGAGSRWAERRTTFTGPDGRVFLEAAALWVCVDVETLRPVRLSDRFWQMYGESADGRAVSSRLQHRGPAGLAPGLARPWSIRLADMDVFNHVNNAMTWAAVEEETARLAPDERIAWAEVEYRAPIERDTSVVLASRRDGANLSVWLLDGRSNDSSNGSNSDPTLLASAVVGLSAPGRPGPSASP